MQNQRQISFRFLLIIFKKKEKTILLTLQIHVDDKETEK